MFSIYAFRTLKNFQNTEPISSTSFRLPPPSASQPSYLLPQLSSNWSWTPSSGLLSIRWEMWLTQVWTENTNPVRLFRQHRGRCFFFCFWFDVMLLRSGIPNVISSETDHRSHKLFTSCSCFFLLNFFNKWSETMYKISKDGIKILNSWRYDAQLVFLF